MPRSLRRKIVLLFLTMLAGTMSADAANVEFKPNASVRGSIVVLGDVAKVSGVNAADLCQLELFPAPAANESRIVRASFIRQQLELNGISARENEFTGATMIRIVRVRETEKPGAPAELPDEVLRLVFAKRPIAQGTIIGVADVELRGVDKLPPGIAIVNETEAVVGHEATKAIAINQPIDGRSLRKPLLVSRGQTISVVARAAGVRVRTSAKALADGTRGDTVLVETLDGKQKFSAVVTDYQHVETLGSASESPKQMVKRMEEYQKALAR